jgi:hypothetical protein
MVIHIWTAEREGQLSEAQALIRRHRHYIIGGKAQHK